MLSKCPVSAALPFDGLKKALRFYRDTLGLKLVDGSVKDGFLDFAAANGTRLGVFESNSRKSKDTAAGFEVKDLAKEMAALRRKGVKFEDYDLPDIKTVNGVFEAGGMKAAWFKDPGKNVICLHQSAPAQRRRRASTARA
jgi:catechol 2,3-dioxygenase-like lactoylglutathione lyase family enzyme